MDGKGHDGPGPPPVARLIITESVAFAVPSVQLMVRVVGLPIEGYQGWSGLMGPSEPEVEGDPVTPEGEASSQAVVLADVQE